MDVTSQPRPTATLQIRDPGGGNFLLAEEKGRKKRLSMNLNPQVEFVFVPKKPLPPQTTIFFAMG